MDNNETFSPVLNKSDLLLIYQLSSIQIIKQADDSYFNDSAFGL